MNSMLKALLPYNTIDNEFKLACKIPWSHQIDFFFENQVHANYQMPFQFKLQVDD
jgi:hypothetical protein